MMDNVVMGKLDHILSSSFEDGQQPIPRLQLKRLTSTCFLVRDISDARKPCRDP